MSRAEVRRWIMFRVLPEVRVSVRMVWRVFLGSGSEYEEKNRVLEG